MKCQIPKCGKRAAGSYALVDVCADHKEEMEQEAKLFYRGKIDERETFNKIKYLAQWKRSAAK
ncbi:hypothetical protein J2T12_005070 [Paenibacillus anaericanus]|uniref:hypothetical protein n=1 Tax=Paenibacillus anaericanus TaxID=170367 RepID=UPI002781D7F5|nr:hypothetical protein [Paenibacillus anaericanus]MDQ0091630.1 hypothetical protein [Paenibacillus anaericanus]